MLADLCLYPLIVYFSFCSREFWKNSAENCSFQNLRGINEAEDKQSGKILVDSQSGSIYFWNERKKCQAISGYAGAPWFMGEYNGYSMDDALVGDLQGKPRPILESNEMPILLSLMVSMSNKLPRNPLTYVSCYDLHNRLRLQ